MKQAPAIAIDVEERGTERTVRLKGDWTTAALPARQADLRSLPRDSIDTTVIDLTEVTRLDTGGAWLLAGTARRLREQGAQVTFSGEADRLALIETVGELPRPEPERRPPQALTDVLMRIGRATVYAVASLRDMTSFLGLATLTLLQLPFRPRLVRLAPLAYQIEKTGFDALPIVGLLSFLIGVVLSYQGIDQLTRFGAEIFTVNLVGVAVLREMGVLITAIVVAGRSGSAFAAQIGTMKVNLEVDAMRTIGLDPMALLVLPRMVALLITLPLLAFYADVMGVLGGAVMALFVLDISFARFADQLQSAVSLTTLLIGLVKAPVFGFVIALVGCFQGLQVSSDAESVGLHTTRAVVASIFLVIVLDALFSILFSIIGI